jgi:hypothetical protein
MAKTTQENFNIILAEKATMSSLNGLTTPVGVNQAQLLIGQLNSGSRVSVWRLWAWIVAFVMTIQERLWETTKAELTSLADEAFIGSSRWLSQKMKDAQLGDIPTVSDDFKVVYPVQDDSKKFITKVSIGRENGVVIVKAAASNSDGTLRILSSPEMTYGAAWLNAIQFVAPKAVLVSRVADKVKVNLKVYYSGLYAEDTVLAGVKSAINSFLANTDFDGLISVQGLTDAIQSVTGVKDVEIDSLQARTAASVSWSTFSDQRGYTPFAGYAIFDDGNSTITMISV